MLLFNPKNGATIRDIWIFDKLYFSAKAEEEFKPGDIIDIEDKPGMYLKEIYGFLEDVNAIRAANIIKDRSVEKFICDHEGCGFESKSKIGLTAHKRTHESVIEGVKVAKPLEPEAEETAEDRAQRIVEEAKAAGLEGPGLEIT